MLVFHFFYCRGKNKVFYLLLTHFSVLISTQTRQKQKFGILSLSISFKAVQHLHSRATFYVKLTFWFYTISMKPNFFEHSVSHPVNISCSFTSKFCFTLAYVSWTPYGFMFLTYTLQAWLHGSTDHKWKLHECRFSNPSNPTLMFCTICLSQTDLFCIIFDFQITFYYI